MTQNQIFVKIDEYKEILNIVGIVKNKITKAKETIDKINELKKQENEEIETWGSNLESVSKKVGVIEEALSQVNN
ncbi:MAG: hypothetical protein ABIC91_05080 [Nanoarchaeota archaeon]|nr:hypothetical protein [Nanoarchaeota archaeon]MBU1031188.1 hypothetical protein [Nanoarchaeota archaeon]MBU1850350.1 hypothetical protein [Nanoarchaeota archaeon]